jgi:hypothetical protein
MTIKFPKPGRLHQNDESLTIKLPKSGKLHQNDRLYYVCWVDSMIFVVGIGATVSVVFFGQGNMQLRNVQYRFRK